MMRKWMLAILSLWTAAAFAAEESDRPEPLSEFNSGSMKWSLSQYATLKDQILTVKVPEQATGKSNWTSTEIDLKPFRSQTLCFTVKARAINVSKPAQSWNGVKFMLNYLPAGGTERWHHPSNLFGSFEWQEIAFSAGIDANADKGKLILGLQDSNGEVEFDLSSLKVYRTFAMVNSDYVVNYPDRIKNMPLHRGVMSPHTMTEDDFKTLKAWHVNLIRLQITRFWGQSGTDRDLDDYDKWLGEKLDHLDQVLKWANEYGIKVIIDLHSPPGGRDKTRDMTMFYDKKYADHFIKVWQRIAKRYQGNPAVWGYDLVNEPVQSRPAKYDYWTLQRMAAEAVREIDPDTPIIIESNEWDSPNAFAYLPPLKMDNVIYQVHMYIPGTFTHQGVHNTFGEQSKKDFVTYPGMIEGAEWNIDQIRKALKPVRDFQQKHNARILVGEFSAIAWAPGADQYLQDCITVFEENNWDWTYHAFREWPGWSVEHVGSNPDDLKLAPEDTARKKVLLKGYLKNVQP